MNSPKASNRAGRLSDESISGPQVQVLFEDIFEGSAREKVNPFHCVPFTKIRPLCSYGVRRLASLFDFGSDDNGSLLPGLIVGSDLPMVIALTGAKMNFVREYLSSQGLDDEEVESIVSQQDKWYVIVDGSYCNESIKSMMTSKPEWLNCEWTVLQLRSDYPLERYKQFARETNARHDKELYVYHTVSDELYNLKSEYDRMTREQSKPTHTDFARAYFGFSTVNRTMTLKTSTAVRLPRELLNTLGDIMYGEHPDLCISSEKINNGGASTEEAVMEKTDCRFFRHFVTLTSIRQSTVFMNPCADDGKQAQINTLYRAKHYYQFNGFKPVQNYTITALHKTSLLSLKEEKKFLQFLGSNTWPSELEQIKVNMLRTTIIDMEIEANQGNELSILPALTSALQRVNPRFLNLRDEFLKSLNEEKDSNDESPPTKRYDTNPNNPYICQVPDTMSDSTQSVPVNNHATSGDLVENGEESTATANKSGNNANDNNKSGMATTNNKSKQNNDNNSVKSKQTELKSEDEILKLCVQDDVSKLEEKGIICKHIKWQYYTYGSSSQKRLANAIITQPPCAPSRSFVRSLRKVKTSSSELPFDEVKQFPEFCQENLLAGVYVLLIILFYSFPEWYEAFYSAGFSVMEYPYVLTKDSKTLPVRLKDRYPQCGNDYALVATNPGRHPQHFKPRFNTSFEHIDCTNDCTLATMFNIPQPRSKLYKPGTRIPFHANELSVKMLCALMDLFNAHVAHIMDPYAGSMTTSIASITTNRVCISIECDELCFQTGVQRLRSLLPRASFNGPIDFSVYLDAEEGDSSDGDYTILDEHCPPMLKGIPGMKPNTPAVLGTIGREIPEPESNSPPVPEAIYEPESNILTCTLRKNQPEVQGGVQKVKSKKTRLTSAQKLRQRMNTK